MYYSSPNRSCVTRGYASGCLAVRVHTGVSRQHTPEVVVALRDGKAYRRIIREEQPAELSRRGAAKGVGAPGNCRSTLLPHTRPVHIGRGVDRIEGGDPAWSTWRIHAS